MPSQDVQIPPANNPRPTAFSFCDNNIIKICSIGEMKIIWAHCNALKFQAETKDLCCGNGKHKLKPSPNLAIEIVDLFKGNTVESEHYLGNIRLYGWLFQMTYVCCKEIHLQGWNPEGNCKQRRLKLRSHAYAARHFSSVCQARLDTILHFSYERKSFTLSPCLPLPLNKHRDSLCG